MNKGPALKPKQIANLTGLPIHSVWCLLRRYNEWDYLKSEHGFYEIAQKGSDWLLRWIERDCLPLNLYISELKAIQGRLKGSLK